MYMCVYVCVVCSVRVCTVCFGCMGKKVLAQRIRYQGTESRVTTFRLRHVMSGLWCECVYVRWVCVFGSACMCGVRVCVRVRSVWREWVYLRCECLYVRCMCDVCVRSVCVCMWWVCVCVCVCSMSVCMCGVCVVCVCVYGVYVCVVWVCVCAQSAEIIILRVSVCVLNDLSQSKHFWRSTVMNRHQLLS